MSKNLVSVFLMLFILSLAFSAEQDGQFLLPDLFITAKDERILDSSNKTDLGLHSELKAQDNMIDGSLQKDKGFLDKMKLSDSLSNVMYNDVSFSLGAPSMVNIIFNHGYVLYDMPYFLNFSRYDNKSLYGVENTSSSFFFSIKPDKENNLSFITKQKQLDDANLNIFGVGYKHTVGMPFSYMGRILNANANVVAGSVALSMIQHDVVINPGKITIEGTDLDSKLSLMYLGSKANQLFFLELGLENEKTKSNINNLGFGLQLWSNAGIQKFNFLVDYKTLLKYDSLDVKTKLQLIHEPITLGRLFSTDFIEMDDAVIHCDERFTLGVSVDGILKDQKETFFADLNYYNYLNVLDDIEVPSDKYYSFTGYTDLTILNVGVYFPDVKIVSESVSVRVQYPIVSKKVPNLFSKFIEVGYEKNVFSGKFMAKGNCYLREFGRTTGDNYKPAYFDIDASYEESISNDLSFGIYLENLLAAGYTYLPDRNFRDTVLYGKIKVIF
ncbi:MAG: hypothetical protein WCH76_03090 [Candidatus Riflemargulisbacteria bacterium]